MSETRETLNAMAAGLEWTMGELRLPPITGPGYIIRRARYAKGMLAVRAPATASVASLVAGRVMQVEIEARWSDRENAYIASPAKVARFLEIMRSNENAQA